jgi:hypothetical protein
MKVVHQSTGMVSECIVKIYLPDAGKGPAAGDSRAPLNPESTVSSRQVVTSTNFSMSA